MSQGFLEEYYRDPDLVGGKDGLMKWTAKKLKAEARKALTNTRAHTHKRMNARTSAPTHKRTNAQTHARTHARTH